MLGFLLMCYQWTCWGLSLSCQIPTTRSLINSKVFHTSIFQGCSFQIEYRFAFSSPTSENPDYCVSTMLPPWHSSSSSHFPAPLLALNSFTACLPVFSEGSRVEVTSFLSAVLLPTGLWIVEMKTWQYWVFSLQLGSGLSNCNTGTRRDLLTQEDIARLVQDQKDGSWCRLATIKIHYLLFGMKAYFL